MKVCKDCGEEKQITEFFKTKITKRTGEQRYETICKKCSMDRYAPSRGKPVYRFPKGHVPWCKDKKLSKQHCEKLSESHIGQVAWNKGKRYSSISRRDASECVSRSGFKGKAWRLAVLERDLYACQECGRTDRDRLHAHHVIPFDESIELRFAVDNGKTLCTTCHNKIHGFQIGKGYWTGKKRSPETVAKMIKSRICVPLTEEHRQKLKGRVPWNRGMKGVQVAWNKGKSPDTESRMRMSIAQKKRFKKERGEE